MFWVSLKSRLVLLSIFFQWALAMIRWFAVCFLFEVAVCFDFIASMLSLDQELLSAGGYNVPKTVHEIIAQLTSRLSRWDDRYLQHFPICLVQSILSFLTFEKIPVCGCMSNETCLGLYFPFFNCIFILSKEILNWQSLLNLAHLLIAYMPYIF